MGYASEALDDIKSDLLSELGLDAEFVDYDFGRKRWLGVYVGGSVDSGCIEIGVNVDRIYKMMKQRGIAGDEFNIEA